MRIKEKLNEGLNRFKELPKSIKTLSIAVIVMGAITTPMALGMIHDNNLPAEKINSKQVTTVGQLEEPTKDIVEKIDKYDTGITFDDIKNNPNEYKHKLTTLNGTILDIEQGGSLNCAFVVVDNDVNKLMSLIYESDLLPYDLVPGDKITTKITIGVESRYLFKGSIYPTISALAKEIKVNYSK